MGTSWDAALRYLGQRAHSEAELRVKLGRRFEPDEVEVAIERLHRADLLDDAQFGEDYARSLLNSGKSKRAVASKLQSKGLEDALIDQILREYPDSDEFDRALALAESRIEKMLDLPKETQTRRLLAYLGRRGFSEGICYAAVRRAGNGA